MLELLRPVCDDGFSLHTEDRILYSKSYAGNVDTRLRRLRSGDFDAIVLAVAGLKRLGLDDAIVDYLSVETSVPPQVRAP